MILHQFALNFALKHPSKSADAEIRQETHTSYPLVHGSARRINVPRKFRRLMLAAVLLLLGFTTFTVDQRLQKMKAFVSATLFGAVHVQGQSKTSSQLTSSLLSSTLPSGTVVPASYEGLLRPRVHFSPPTGFMNDPNGLFIDSKQVWHQYYQYNPYGTIAGNQTWGHATSRDLYHWEVQPIALAPTNGSDLVFSGSAVLDMNNTSGFFPSQTNGVVAIFTIAGPDQQVQAIAYSHDDGYTFVRYEGNPVLQIGSANFRDPKVIWHAESQKWIMVLSFAQDFTIGIYTSPNLKTWSFASNFSHHGILGYQYECPNLVQMPMEGALEPMWLMYISINPGAPLGGSMGQYFPGSFNGTHFTPVDSVARIADFGKDNYATQFWYGIPGDQPQVSIGWASNWEYTNRVPTGPLEGWASAFSVPRLNYLKNITRVGYNLVSQPYDIEAVQPNTTLIHNPNFGNGSVSAMLGLYGGSGAILIDVHIAGLNVTASGPVASLNFTIRSTSSGESLSGGQFFAGDYIFWLNRGKTMGFDDVFFVDKFSTSNLLEDTYHLQVIMDHSVMEAFILDGEKSATVTFFPTAALDNVAVVSQQINPGAVVNLTIWELEDTWKQFSNFSGIYNGNSTAQTKRLQMLNFVY